MYSVYAAQGLQHTTQLVQVIRTGLPICLGFMLAPKEHSQAESDWVGHSHMYFSKPGGEQGVDSGVLQQVLGKLGATCRAVRLAMIDVLLEAFEAKVVLACGRHRPFAQLQADAALQLLHLPFIHLKTG